MRTFKEKVARRARWWAVSTVVVLALVLAMGYATIRMIVGIPVEMQAGFLYLFGGIWLTVTFILGQGVNNILVRGWDVWIADLGPTQIEVLVKEMEKRRAQLEEEEK
jgi:hypothetical protein